MLDKKLIDKTDLAILELIYNKYELLKAYHYYNGLRDPEQYRYLEENFGIGNPTSVEFTPLLKKHVDALVGEYLGTPILPKISCKDTDTISNITREKLLLITLGIVKFLKDHLSNSILLFIDGKDITDKSIKNLLDKLILDIDQSFISQYEIAALNILLYIILSRETDLMTKLRLLLTDLLITGYTFFRVKPSISGSNIEIEVLNPLNTFIDRNADSPYIKNSYRAVVRYWLTESLILAKYGKEITKADLKSLRKDSTEASIIEHSLTEDSRVGLTNIPGYPESEVSNRRFLLIPVYDVEWLETDKDFIMQRYNTIRIGLEIYILRGKDEKIVRSLNNPSFCELTINGVYFLNRSQQPYSLILKCAHLQDRYDLLHYYKDSLIANSGSSGVIMDMSLLPANLGVKWPERVLKWLAYKKAGIQWVDTTLEGRNDNAPLNTIFNGFDDTLQALAVLAIELAILSVESTTSSITGVFRERLNGIDLKDAVTNIKLGVSNSFTVTKHYFLLMDLIACEILLGCLNLAKNTFKKGLLGVLILGDKYLQIFTALPEHFTITDYDIHVISSTEVMEDIQILKGIIPEFIKSLGLPPEIIFEALTSKSLTDLKYKVKKAMLLLKEENNLLKQLSEKLEELSLQLSQLLNELKLALSKAESLNEERMKLEQSKILLEYLVGWFKAQTERTFKTRSLDIEEERTKMEILQLSDGNPYNDGIKQVK